MLSFKSLTKTYSVKNVYSVGDGRNYIKHSLIYIKILGLDKFQCDFRVKEDLLWRFKLVPGITANFIMNLFQNKVTIFYPHSVIKVVFE